MRRPFAVGALCLVALGVAMPAEAWYGYIARLSGAGPFRGVQFEARLLCVGDRVVPPALATAFATSERETAQLRRRHDAPERTQRDETELQQEWGNLRQEWENLLQRPAPDQQVRPPATLEETRLAAEAARNEVYRALQLDAHATAVGAGVQWSLCSKAPTELRNRRVSVELGTRYTWAAAEPQYANNERITLVTLVPAVTWRVFRDPRYDVLDVGTGGGVYWFTSPGFESLRGVILEPVRLDLHGPSGWSERPVRDVRRWLAVVNVRAAMVTFPAGFEPDDFAATGDAAVRLPAEALPSFTIYANLEALIGRLMR